MKIQMLLLLITLLLSLSACESILQDSTCKTVTTHRVTILIDKTDTSTVRAATACFRPDSVGLCPILRSLEEAGIYQYASCTVNELSLGFITELGEEPQIKHSHKPLPPDATAYQLKTNKGVVSFRKHFSSVLDTQAIGASVRSASKIWEPLSIAINEINRTHKTTGSETLIVFSDGLENANGISLYGSQGRDTVALWDNLVKKYGPLPDASGIDVVFVAPRSVRTDENIDHSSRFWSMVFSGLHPKSFSFRASLVLPVNR